MAARWLLNQAPPQPADITDLSCETDVAFTHTERALGETAIAFARAGSDPIGTIVTFASETRAFVMCFSIAGVMMVSMVAVWGRALAMAVSHWPASAVVMVMVVLQLPCGCVLCTNKFAQRTREGLELAVYGALGEFFAKTPQQGLR